MKSEIFHHVELENSNLFYLSALEITFFLEDLVSVLVSIKILLYSENHVEN